MKLSKIAIASASACGLLACGSAFAIPASSYTNTGEFAGDTLNIRISGASAQDNGVLGSALSLCTAGSVTRYSVSNNAVFFCTPDIGTGPGQITVPAGKTKLAIYKYSVGGSAFGVTPINTNTAADGSALGANGNLLPFLDLTKIAANCTNATATGTFGTALGTYANVGCTSASSLLTTLATTYIGLSDVEPAFFTTSIGNITSAQATALIFGVPVSINVRNAMQTQQGLNSGSDTEADMPSLSSGQVVSAFTQTGQTWAGLGVTTAFVDNTVYVARRVDSSGTQKTFEALIAHSPNGQGANKSCSVGTELFVTPDSGTAGVTTGDADTLCSSSTPPLVYGGSGGSNVRNCMVNHNSQARGAIGILTTEDKPGTANWRFVKIDGVSPTQANAAAGKYRFYTETALNTRTAGAFATAAALGYSAFVTRLGTDLGNPSIVKQINGADQTFGSAGLMALLSRNPALTADFTGAATVIPFTKLISGTTLDNCQGPKVVF